MLEIKRVNNNDIRSLFEIKGGELVYSLLLENQNIGYGIIRNNSECKIEIYILDEYQGNGYGNYLFTELLNKVKDNINLKVDLCNNIMRRIIKKNGGIELGRNGKYIYYVIKK